MIVVLDACVLYPPSLRDLLLTLAALDAFDVRWSDEILDEVSRNVVADHPDIDADRFVEHTIGAMRRAFPEASIPVATELVEALDNDPKDRHVTAVAPVARRRSRDRDAQRRRLRQHSVARTQRSRS